MPTVDQVPFPTHDKGPRGRGLAAGGQTRRAYCSSAVAARDRGCVDCPLLVTLYAAAVLLFMGLFKQEISHKPTLCGVVVLVQAESRDRPHPSTEAGRMPQGLPCAEDSALLCGRPGEASAGGSAANGRAYHHAHTRSHAHHGQLAFHCPFPLPCPFFSPLPLPRTLLVPLAPTLDTYPDMALTHGLSLPLPLAMAGCGSSTYILCAVLWSGASSS